MERLFQKMSVYIILLSFLYTFENTRATSSAGKTFLLVCPESEKSNTKFILHINFPNYDADVTVTVPLLNVTLSTYTGILQGSTKDVFLDETYELFGTGISNNSILVSASDDISVHITSETDGDGYMGIPVDSLGTEYYIVTYCEDSYFCLFSVSAVEDSSQIEITLSISKNTVSVILDGVSYRHGDVISVILNSYQTIQIKCEADVTGTYITSNKPVAVIGGSSGSTVAGGVVTSMLMEQFPPVTAYGREVLTVPSKYTQTIGDYYRIITSQPFTLIQIGAQGRRIVPIRGYWFQIRITNHLIFTSDKPILVTRITQGAKTIPASERPSMMILVPTEQFLTGNNVKVVLPTCKILTNWIILISRAPFQTQIYVNNVIQDVGWISIPGSTLYIKYVQGSLSTNQYIFNLVARAFMVYHQVDTTQYSSSYAAEMKLLATNPECIVSETSHGDTVDNDCDGLIDEDVCPFPLPAVNVGKDCEEIVFGSRDSFGRRFIMAFPEHVSPGNQVSLIFSTFSSLTVSVMIKTPLNEMILDAVLSVNGSLVFSFNDSVEVQGTATSNMGILIEASEEISVYSVSDKSAEHNTAGSTRCLPLETLGKEYFAVTICEAPANKCQITIVAAHPKTIVRVTVHLKNTSAAIQYVGKTYLHGDTIVELLSQYQVWQLQCDNDLTGTRITSDKPVGVSSGSQYTFHKTIQQQDQMVEQMLPVVAWGTTSTIVQTPLRLGTNCWFPVGCEDVVRVIASEGDTVISVKTGMDSTVITFNLNYTGDWIEFTLNMTAYIESTKAVSVTQLLTDGVNYDAGMLVIIPLEQYGTADFIKVISDSQYIYHLIIITHGEFSANISVNQSHLTTAIDFPDAMSYIYEPLVAGQEVVIGTDNASITMGGYFYTQQTQRSYIFPLASYHRQINMACEISTIIVGDNVDNDCDGRVDEEPCNTTSPQDFDFDGMFDEDCAQELVPLSSIESSLTSSSSVGITSSEMPESTVDMSSLVSSIPSTVPTSVIVYSDSISNIQLSSYSKNDVFSSMSETDVHTNIATSGTSLIGMSSTYVMTSGNSVCSCLCLSITTPIDAEALAEVTDSIKADLYVDAKEVSKTIRKYISVPDPRVSAQTVGYFGVAIISGIFIGIFILDAGALFKDLANLINALKEINKK